MTLPQFTESASCASRVHCQHCRDRSEAGLRFRAGMQRAFTLPGDNSDFDCPHGFGWGYVAPPVQPLSPPRPAPLPFDQWPWWAKRLAKKRVDTDVGLGDTVHRRLGVVGAAFEATLAAMGATCGCADRRAAWNALYRYGTNATAPVRRGCCG